ncbi:glycosyltransferase family 4 protein [Mariniblastus fucicola]|uniref:GDP-mannose-dependent alpha-(1-6)-phosphatidylinositol monomannoside mannosyltransferase n=1 Tax=Mariniblastus fucicola TaxID=980251 RepID=A0A5B9P1V7_9BACT|nr:glycosyltransferase family 1 protein [Mariniblastus fucicola]QEG20298.1 GDP-mannose-dependent alpha-(1-6)-phosphatidylinositol monomannoside mannosyltransferase [Mariniblastus fucicola]
MLNKEDLSVPYKIPDKPRLGIFTRPIDQGRSGSGKHADRLLTEFVRINDTFDLFFIHYEKSSHPIYSHGTDVIIPRNPLRASLALRKYNLSIVHYHPLSIMSPIAMLPGKKVATIHGAAEDFIPGHYSLSRRLNSRLIKPAFSRKMDLIFTVSETSRVYLAKKYGVNQNRFRVVYNAVDSRFTELPEVQLGGIREKYTKGRRFVLHISNYSMRKNPLTVLHGFKQLRNSMPDTPLALVIVGNGWDQDRQVREIIQDEGLAGDVILPGYIPTDDVPKLLNLADVFVFPSLYEGFGMPNLEAMACGCPVITSSEFAIPEIVGESAITLVNTKDPKELADSMRSVISDSQLRQSLVSKGLRQAKQYSWKQSAEATLEAYEQLLTSSGK